MKIGLIFLGVAIYPFAMTAVVNSLPAGPPIDGVRCDRMEGSAFHIHQHLSIYDRGKPVEIPDNVGRPIVAGCIYWIHTHTSDGIIHVESPVLQDFDLGQFFALWGEPLTRTRADGAVLRKGEKMTVWVDGSRYTGDPKNIQLAQHTDIVIDVGPPAPKPTPFTNWGPN
ncbi:MAG: hypothetical protein JO101_09685 [Candidatus Eremiobacteraeota bacterium]|nr:hypothetical protein [Candidatus Eremiobacteraeota bacterium]MBV8355580.1 hypothetical protein [Candidatus Eremiobacteraeota bacterium]